MKTYPIMLNLHGRRAVVVGAGSVGMRKVRDLLAAGAEVTLIEQHAEQTEAPAGVKMLSESYRPEHLRGASLVFACTDDAELNRRIAADARADGALVNAADQPEDCDFFVPATAGDGNVVVAVGTGGSSPALAGRLARTLADALPEDVGAYADALAEVRRRLISSGVEAAVRRRALLALGGEEGYAAFLDGGADALWQMAEKMTRDR
ncbi:MAG: precorrin-2 dehydrogenase/sirohydrochlorin ferrochelatase family protein [Phycisphaerae bacterium]